MLESKLLINNGYNPTNIYLPNDCIDTHNHQCANNSSLGVNLFFGPLSKILLNIPEASLSVVDYDACGMPSDLALSDISKIIESKLCHKSVLGVTFCCRSNTKLRKNKFGETTYSNRDYTMQKIYEYAILNGFLISVIENFSYTDCGSTTMFRQLYTLETKDKYEDDDDEENGDAKSPEKPVVKPPLTSAEITAARADDIMSGIQARAKEAKMTLKDYAKSDKNIQYHEEDGDDEYIFESFIKFDPRNKKVLVKWEGYDELTWEPHDQFKSTDQWRELMSRRKLF
jgi:hypothetical protein